jgi:Tfp pilus assembly protein PilF
VRRAMNERRPNDFWIAANGYMLSGRYDEAVGLYREAIALRPDYTEAWLNLGKTLYLAKNFPSAEKAFARAVDLDPENAPAMSNRALCLAALGHGAQAEELWRKSLEVEPYNPLTLTEFGRFLVDAGKYGEAQVLLERAHTVDSQNVEPVLLLVRIAQATGDKKALALWTDLAQRLDPKRVGEEMKRAGADTR